MTPVKYRVFAVLSIFTALFISLSVCSYSNKSATFDEPLHLLAGYGMLKYHDYRFSVDHMPLLRKWAAVPLLFMRDVKFDTNVFQQINTTEPYDWFLRKQYGVAHDFLYRWNDADRLLFASHLMMSLLGVALGILVFCWVHELFGFWPATFALGLYTLEPNLLAHSPLVTTDVGLALFVFGSAYFLWRITRRLTPWNLAGLCVFTALAFASKVWAALLLVSIPLCLVIWLTGKPPWPCRWGKVTELSTPRSKWTAAFLIWVSVGVACYIGIWMAYGFQHRASMMSDAAYHFEYSETAQKNDAAQRTHTGVAG